MDLNWMIEKVREHPDFGKIGMIASHLGVVRASSRDGRAVTRLEVQYDQGVIDDIVRDIK
ncbi:MAG: molybdenum cofactor biosynthesis protein MoaE, partial [Deltaproteobacteria bacterium]|nr:molybdenum cofactor biosynthesis protein MoaE [Deltaproteobacteria bacterium]